MRFIKDIISTPSEAIDAMVDGLVRQDAREDFVINMGTFLDRRGGKCFGCAATCTIQELTGADYNPSMPSRLRPQRAITGDLDLDDLREFEVAIDMLRRGHAWDLFFYFGIDTQYYRDLLYAPFELEDDDWEEQLPAVLRYNQKLKEMGL